MLVQVAVARKLAAHQDILDLSCAGAAAAGRLGQYGAGAHGAGQSAGKRLCGRAGK